MQEAKPEYINQYKENAQQKFESDLNPFLLKLFGLGINNLKAKLTQEGLTKVLAIELKRDNNHAFNQEMSEQTWELLEEICNAAVK